MKLITNHITFTSMQDVINICSPLRIFDINFFCYNRFYFDGTSFSLLTNSDWYEHFLKHEIPESVNVYNIHTGNCLWRDIFPEESVAIAENFNLNHAFNFNYKYPDYMEIFTYASILKSNRGLENIMKNLNLLEKFNNYFKKQGQDIILAGEKNKITIPKIMRGYSKNNTMTDKRAEFLTLIGYSIYGAKSLSNREHECLWHLARGMTVKEIARTLNILPRTVQSYIENVKNKLNCANKSELANLYWDFFY